MISTFAYIVDISSSNCVVVYALECYRASFIEDIHLINKTNKCDLKKYQRNK